MGLLQQELRQLQPVTPYPSWRPLEIAGPVVEKATHTDTDGNLQTSAVPMYPLLLQWIAHTDEQHVGTRCIDFADDFGRAGLILNVSVMKAGQPPARKHFLTSSCRPLDRARVGAKQKVTIPAASSRVKKLGNQVRANEVGFQSCAAQASRPPRSCPVGEYHVA